MRTLKESFRLNQQKYVKLNGLECNANREGDHALWIQLFYILI